MKEKKILFITDRDQNCWICELNSVKSGLILTDADYSVSTGVMTLHDPPQAIENESNANVREATEQERAMFLRIKDSNAVIERDESTDKEDNENTDTNGQDK